MTTRRSHRPPKRGKSQQRAEATKRAVLETALQEFAQFGLEGARVDRIAARARVNKQALYYYFGNKEGLFAATLAAVYDRAPPVPGEPDTAAAPAAAPAAAMRALIATLFDHYRSAEQGSSVIAHENRYHGRHLTPEVRGRIRSAVSPLIAVVESALARGQRSGAFSRGVRAADLYLTIVALSHFYFTHAYTLSAILGDDLLSPRAVAAWKRHVGDFVIAALQPPVRQKKSTK
jgi:TetR/AcrR family transcriptional regulator